LKLNPKDGYTITVPKKTFKHSGDLGDIIFSLPTIRELGGGILFLDPNGGESEPLIDWGDGRFTRTKLTKDSIDGIKPLLELQDYIEEVRYWNGESVDFNLDRFREHVVFNNLSDSHLATCNLPISVRDEKWLSVPSALPAIDGKTIALARSCRYHGNYSFWEGLDKDIVEKAFFLGWEREYEYFVYTFPHMAEVPRLTVESLLEMAQILEGVELFIGNQGLPHAIAEALKRPLINEVFRAGPGPAAIFEREGAEYV